MNKLSFLILLMFFLSACQSGKTNDSNDEKGVPVFDVQPEIHNFGVLESGELVSFSFKVTNTGTGLLTIDSVGYSCGCLQVVWPEKGIKAGETRFVQVNYDSAGEWGSVYQPLVIFTNASEKKKNVYIAAKVNNQLFNQE